MLKEYNKIVDELSSIYSNKEAEAITLLLFEEYFNINKLDISIQRKNKFLTNIQKEKLNNVLSLLLNHVPIQQIIGKVQFYNCEIKVDSSVLIPRPETEELVMIFLEQNKKANPKILDIGTGSGCIAIAIKKNVPKAKVLALDVSNDAIKVAKKNSIKNNCKIIFYNTDILDIDKSNELDNDFDYIISNPPYVLLSEKPEMDRKVVDFEPHNALFVSNSEPLIFYKAIAEFASNHLKNNGQIYLEINERFGKEIMAVLANKNFQEIRLVKDINEKDRFIIAKKIN